MYCHGIFQSIEIACLSLRGVTLQREAVGGWISITFWTIIGFTSHDDLTCGIWRTMSPLSIRPSFITNTGERLQSASFDAFVSFPVHFEGDVQWLPHSVFSAWPCILLPPTPQLITDLVHSSHSKSFMFNWWRNNLLVSTIFVCIWLFFFFLNPQSGTFCFAFWQLPVWGVCCFHSCNETLQIWLDSNCSH